MSAMPAATDRIIRANPSRAEPRVFVNPEYADPSALGQVIHDLRALLRDARRAVKELGQENERGQRLSHSITPVLRRHAELAEQHAQVLKLIDQRAGEAAAVYQLIADRAAKIDLFDKEYDRRVDGMRALLERIDTRLDGSQAAVDRIEEQASMALLRLRREFDAHLIQSADDANARLASGSDRIESALDEAMTVIAASRKELDAEVSGARACVREAIAETRDATDSLYRDLDQRKTEAVTAALEVEETLDNARDAARRMLTETRTRIDNTMKLGRLKLDELCNAFTAWIEAGQASVERTIDQSKDRIDSIRGEIAGATEHGVASLGDATESSIRKIEHASESASSKFEDAERALSEVIVSVRNELTAFDTAMFARVDNARQRLEGLVEAEVRRAERLRAEVGETLDQRLADLSAQCDRAQTILLGEHGPDSTGLLAMLEKAESLERAVGEADQRAAFATRQLEAIREQANQVRKTLGRAVLLAADATDKADARAAMLETALEQAKAATDAIAGATAPGSELGDG